MPDSPLVQFNAIIWITSLKKEEAGLSRRVAEDIEDFTARYGIPFKVYEPNCASEFLSFLDDLSNKARTEGLKPIIHIDTHGSKDDGILISKSGEHIKWSEALKKFRNINLHTNNNLCVISLACFSARLALSMSISDVAPFYVFIAPEVEIAAGYVESNVRGFYKHLFEESDIVGAHEEHLGKIRLIHSEYIFFHSFADYISEHCQGKGAQRRVENLITQARQGGIIFNRPALRKSRKLVKSGIKPNQGLIDTYAARFLIGRSVKFTITDILREVSRRKGGPKSHL